MPKKAIPRRIRNDKVPNPTPQEIEERCKEVQATWDEETRLSRIVDKSLLPYSPTPWMPPIIQVADLPVDIRNVDEPGEYPEIFDYTSPVEEEIAIDAEATTSFETYLNKWLLVSIGKVCDKNSDRAKLL